MASNFRIFLHETRDSLHLKLDGDFDESSAHELFNKLKKHGVGFIKFLLTLMTLRPLIHLVEMCFKRNLVASISNSETLSLLGKMEIKFRQIRSSRVDQCRLIWARNL
jgi:hypothetical protein